MSRKTDNLIRASSRVVAWTTRAASDALARSCLDTDQSKRPAQARLDPEAQPSRDPLRGTAFAEAASDIGRELDVVLGPHPAMPPRPIHALIDRNPSGMASVIEGDRIGIHGRRIRLGSFDAPGSGRTCLDSPIELSG